jgi:Ran GTPase-activating protein (RanGAP) involved in mRNA processing and transport
MTHSSAGDMIRYVLAQTEFSVEGAREVVNKERAESLLAPLLAADAGYVTVKLSTKSFGAGSADVAAAALANNAATLQHADLSDIIAGRPEAEALAALTTVCAT